MGGTSDACEMPWRSIADLAASVEKPPCNTQAAPAAAQRNRIMIPPT
jgi:hypothetical protein